MESEVKEGGSCGSADQATKEVVDIEDSAEEDENFNEILQLDEMLGNASGSVKMLDYEKQMFLDCAYNDGLVICGK